MPSTSKCPLWSGGHAMLAEDLRLLLREPVLLPPAAGGEIDLDVLPLAHVRDTGEAEATERILDGLALGIEDAVLERDADAGFHAPLV